MPRAPNFDSATGGLGLSGHTRSKPVGADVVVAYDVDVSDGLDAALLGGALVSTPLDPDDELIFVQGRAYVCPLHATAEAVAVPADVGGGSCAHCSLVAAGRAA